MTFQRLLVLAVNAGPASRVATGVTIFSRALRVITLESAITPGTAAKITPRAGTRGAGSIEVGHARALIEMPLPDLPGVWPGKQQ